MTRSTLNGPAAPQSIFRAFLSHSSADKELVRQVVDLVGRPYCSVDYVDIDTGDDLLTTIRSSIEGASVFVFFVSGRSLASMWVDAEQRYADYRAALSALSGVLTFIIEDDIELDQLPSWLHRYHVTRSRSPKVIVRRIGRAIDDAVRNRQSPTYIGRGTLEAALTGDLLPAPGESGGHALWLYGLPGVGRRTVLRHLLKDVLRLHHLVDAPIRPGASVLELALVLADELGQLRSPTSAKELADYFAAASSNERVEITVDLVRQLCMQGEAPLVLDEGGLLDSRAQLRPEWRDLVSELVARRDTYSFFVSARRPYHLGLQPHVPVVNVPPLDSHAVSQILARVAELREVVIAKADAPVIVESIRGYLPSITAVVELVASHGSAYVAQDAPRLARFRTGPMARYLNTLDVTPIGQRILGLLAAVSPLPAEVISAVVRDPECPAQLGKLLDESLVVPTAHGSFEIAAPIEDLVAMKFHSPRDGRDLAELEAQLSVYVDSLNEEAWMSSGTLDVFRSYQRAVMLNGGQCEWALPSDMIRSVQALYHRRDYEECERLARNVIDLFPEQEEPYQWLIRALAKLGDCDEADRELKRWHDLASPRDYHFLAGFVARHRREVARAIHSYEMAYNLGRRDVAVHRELAGLYAEVGDIPRAQEMIAAVESAAPNRFILDLRIRIACAAGDEETARSMLYALEAVDERLFFLRRASLVEGRFGTKEAAFSLMRQALELSRRQTLRPPFEVLSDFVDAAIDANSRSAATDALEELNYHYPRRNGDVRRGLKVKLLNAEGRFDKALEAWDAIADKGLPVHLALRRKALSGMADRLPLWDPQRDAIRAEIADLTARIGTEELSIARNPLVDDL